MKAASKEEVDEQGTQIIDEEEEQAIEAACRATDRVIKKAMDASNTYTVPRAVLQYVNRKETGSENNERPLHHKASTQKNYARVWVSLLRYP